SRLAGAAADAPVQPLSQLLSQWLEWKQAVALARVLDIPVDAVPAEAGEAADAAAALSATRDSLAQSIARDRAFAAPPEGPRPPRPRPARPCPPRAGTPLPGPAGSQRPAPRGRGARLAGQLPPRHARAAARRTRHPPATRRRPARSPGTAPTGSHATNPS